MTPYLIIDVIRRVSLSDEGKGFCPSQGCPFPVAINGRLAPSLQEVDAFLAFTVPARVPGVHINTESAAIDLGDADQYQVDQALLQAAIVNIGLKIEHRFHRVQGYGIGVEPCFHGNLSDEWSQLKEREARTGGSSPQRPAGRNISASASPAQMPS